jgi:hypothetical protein
MEVEVYGTQCGQTDYDVNVQLTHTLLVTQMVS